MTVTLWSNEKNDQQINFVDLGFPQKALKKNSTFSFHKILKIKNLIVLRESPAKDILMFFCTSRLQLQYKTVYN